MTNSSKRVLFSFPVTLGYPRSRLCSTLPGLRRKYSRVHCRRNDGNLHDLRHSTASLLAQRGVSLQVIGAILGHSSPQTAARSSHLIEDNKRDTMALPGENPGTRSRQSRKKSAA
jgi:integrase